MQPASHTATFLQEAEELLEQVQTAALELETAPQDSEPINRLFRAFHTIKGSAAMVDLTVVSGFTHHVETALDRVREGSVRVTPELISVVLTAKDHIEALLAAVKHGAVGPVAQGEPIIAQLNRLCAAAAPQPVAATASGIRTTYQILFKPKDAVFEAGIDPNDVIADLRKLGPCEVELRFDPAQPEAADQRPQAYVITLSTQEPEETIRDAFIFVEQDSELTISRGMSEFVTVPPQQLPAASAQAPQPAPMMLPELKEPAQVAKAARAGGGGTVRVASERLDQLVKLVGELVINQSRLQQAHASGQASELAGPVEAMERLIAELRDNVFGIRMMPIGTTFNRFQRLVRDLASELDKEIALVTEGEETELDKTVLDQLGDPLVHMIRNSIDHGIERPAEREAQGKPRRGTVLLTAAHDGNQVVITIQDDGRGLDPAKLRQKAIEKGLIEATAQLTEQECFDLILRPGFSTAAAVTQLSGRGVGMDVVKKTVESLRGSLLVTSVLGKGTRMRLQLPLTLAIIDGLLVEIEGDRFIVPMAAVTENVELPREDRRANNGRNAVAVRGELVPYIRLRELFESPGEEIEIEKVVIVSLEGQRVGLVVDSVIGSHQTVIQPLGPFYRGIELFSGSTIMGDGRVAMILDLPGTVRHAGDKARLDAETQLQ